MALFPILRYLVPADPVAPGDDFARIKQPLIRGVPTTIQLEGTLDLALTVPTGVARIWAELDPNTVVLDSADDEAAVDMSAAPPPAPPPARLVLRSSGAVLATVPLVVGPPRTLPDRGGVGAGQVALWILGYRLHVGTVLGGGDFGSFVELAWRHVDRGELEYVLPPLPAGLALRDLAGVQAFLEPR